MKFRAGWNDQELVHVNMAQLAEDCGLQAVALHPRTREQGYSGKADWTRIAEVKAAVKIPVIGNGDILTPEDAVRMVARDRLRRRDGRPHGIVKSLDFSSDRAVPRHRRATIIRRSGSRYDIMRTYYAMLREQRRPDAVGKMKQFATYFTHGVRNGSKLRVEIYRATEAAQILDAWTLFSNGELTATAA